MVLDGLDRLTPYIAVHDYQSGAVILRIYATSKREIQKVLPEPNWRIYDKDDDQCPSSIDESSIHNTSLAEPSELLLNFISAAKRTADGKSLFWFRLRSGRAFEYRKIYARSESEVLDRFPLLESMMLKPITPDIVQTAGSSDIDVLDTFLKRAQR